MLKVNDIHVYYGAIHAIKGITFEVSQGEIVTLIGANGAGKTTILHTLSGLIKQKSGDIVFKNKKLNKIQGNEIVSMGMAQVPEGRRVFSQMTVYENIEMGAFLRKDKDGIKKDLDLVFQKFPRLKERRKQLAGTLSGGEQQMLAIARALMSKPELLLLDEPSMGLAPILVDEIFNTIEEINKMGTTILLVEQNAHRALSIANRAYVLETGNIVMQGNAKELLGNKDVQKAYLGA